MHEAYTLRDSSILAISGSVKSEGSAAVFQSRENQKAQCDRSLGFSAAALSLLVAGTFLGIAARKWFWLTLGFSGAEYGQTEGT